LKVVFKIGVGHPSWKKYGKWVSASFAVEKLNTVFLPDIAFLFLPTFCRKKFNRITYM